MGDIAEWKLERILEEDFYYSDFDIDRFSDLKNKGIWTTSKGESFPNSFAL